MPLDSISSAVLYPFCPSEHSPLPTAVLLEASCGPAPLPLLREGRGCVAGRTLSYQAHLPNTPTDSLHFPPFYRNVVPCRAVQSAASSLCFFLYSLSLPPSHQEHSTCWSLLHIAVHPNFSVRYLPDIIPLSFHLHSTFSSHLLDTQS